MTNVFLPYNLQPQTFAQTLFQTPSGISLVGGSAVFTGDPDSSSTFDSLLLGGAVINTKGILLTTGDGTPPTINTRPADFDGYSVSNLTPGDSELRDIVSAAFEGDSETFDAASLEFQVNADKGIKTIIFDIVFGSDEYPEYAEDFVDIAAIFVNGKNAAFFAGDKGRPLSVLDKNLGYFQDNTDSHITIEYDGVSNKLTVIAAVKEGVNDIRIAIADTGDTIYDSGIFVSNLRGSTQDLEGILNEVTGDAGNNKLKAIKDIDNILFGGEGSDKLLANNGFDILYGDELEPESGAGTTGRTTDPEVAALGDFKDTFFFKSLGFLEKKISKTDVIGDFDKLDVINLSKLTGPKLDFIGKDGFSDNGDGEVRYKLFKSKDYTAVYVDTNGDGNTDASLKLLGLHKLKDGDFVL